MSVCVLDCEGNGLIEDGADTIWCAVLKDTLSGEILRFYPGGPLPRDGNEIDYLVEELPEVLDEYDNIVMHNGLEYDRVLIKRALDYSIPLERITDTYILSGLLNPDRKVPEGWIGFPKPHSVEAWAMRFGKKKVEHEDWSRFSPEMLHRCVEDVLIQEQILYALNKEAEE